MLPIELNRGLHVNAPVNFGTVVALHLTDQITITQRNESEYPVSSNRCRAGAVLPWEALQRYRLV